MQTILPFANPVAADGDDEDITRLPNVGICAKVYAYCEVTTVAAVEADAFPRYDPAVHGRPVYVGQTINDLRNRDAQHYSDNLTLFDRQYKCRSMYILVVLTERHFAAAQKDEDFKDETLHPAGAWMDYWETKYISDFDTYNNGLNSTKGGQGHGWLVAMREATASHMFARFRDFYMPAFRKYYEKEGHANAPRSHPILKNLPSNIRIGNTLVPPHFEDELVSMGFDSSNQHIVKRDKMWEEVYIPAFREYYKDKGHINAPRSHPILGRLVDSIRRANTQVPLHLEEDIFAMGLDLRNQNIVKRDKMWEEVYMPAFRNYYKKEGHVNAPQTYSILGKLVDNIRNHGDRHHVPPHLEDELFSMGLNLRNQHIVKRDKMWEEVYIPAFREYYKDKGHINAPRSHPILGILVDNIRTKQSQVPSHFKNELRTKGFCWSSNLAMHVAFILGRTPGPLEKDTEAKSVVEEAVQIHARLCSLRKGIKDKDALIKASLYKLPFGTKPLDNGMARFVADLQKLNEKQSKTKKRKCSD